MNVSIRINRDFLTAYKDDVWKGFDTRELICAGIACACGLAAGAAVHFISGLAISACIYAAVPFMLPALLIGFFKYQGYLSALDAVREMAFTSEVKSLRYESPENDLLAAKVFTTDSMPSETGKKRCRKKSVSGSKR